ncbi:MULTISPECIES: FHA domain-containing protein [unclassified Sinorhizobium]|uniref:FHA domain-containing protein n=1 Tax=unclassified Sinorhizobium TaxID=2613772 RepID=UPI0024C355D8|nr:MULTISPECIES: FHA domain-containing protein [unclassified Sinorhizobium]MDK1378221.1 FHA domain-containing protein [Sinorhizobium sp. 6-70]MDK1482068.1 FHA domain-containing protein [Sinorhizobium sp. 6-117]
MKKQTGEQAELALRVLSGPNRGAETSLGEGVWLIGSHDTDDLTFADPQLAGSHLSIAITAGGIEITALAPGVRVGGQDLPTDNPTVLEPTTPVQVGRTIFGVMLAGHSFPDVDSTLEGKMLDAPHLSSALENPSVLDGHEAPLSTGSTPRQLRLGALICGFVIITCVGFWAGMEWVPALTLTAVSAPDRIKIARNVLRDLGIARDIKFSLSGERLVIDSELPPGEGTKLQAALRGAGLTVEVAPKGRPATPSGAKLIDLATTVMRAFGIEGSARVGDAGQIALAGYGPSDASVEAALLRLQQDIPGAHKIDDEIATPERARAFLETVTATQLRHSIRIVTKPHVVLVSGMLTPAAYNEWTAVSSRFQKKFSPHIRLETRFSPVLLPAPRGLDLGPTPFIVIENRKHLKVGDNVDHVGKIVAIDHDGVLVHIGESDVHVLYPSKPRWIAEEGQ